MPSFTLNSCMCQCTDSLSPLIHLFALMQHGSTSLFGLQIRRVVSHWKSSTAEERSFLASQLSSIRNRAPQPILFAAAEIDLYRIAHQYLYDQMPSIPSPEDLPMLPIAQISAVLCRLSSTLTSTPQLPQPLPFALHTHHNWMQRCLSLLPHRSSLSTISSSTNDLFGNLIAPNSVSLPILTSVRPNLCSSSLQALLPVGIASKTKQTDQQLLQSIDASNQQYALNLRLRVQLFEQRHQITSTTGEDKLLALQSRVHQHAVQYHWRAIQCVERHQSLSLLQAQGAERIEAIHAALSLCTRTNNQWFRSWNQVLNSVYSPCTEHLQHQLRADDQHVQQQSSSQILMNLSSTWSSLNQMISPTATTLNDTIAEHQFLESILSQRMSLDSDSALPPPPLPSHLSMNQSTKPLHVWRQFFARLLGNHAARDLDANLFVRLLLTEMDLRLLSLETVRCQCEYQQLVSRLLSMACHPSMIASGLTMPITTLWLWIWSRFAKVAAKASNPPQTCASCQSAETSPVCALPSWSPCQPLSKSLPPRNLFPRKNSSTPYLQIVHSDGLHCSRMRLSSMTLHPVNNIKNKQKTSQPDALLLCQWAGLLEWKQMLELGHCSQSELILVRQCDNHDTSRETSGICDTLLCQRGVTIIE